MLEELETDFFPFTNLQKYVHIIPTKLAYSTKSHAFFLKEGTSFLSCHNTLQDNREDRKLSIEQVTKACHCSQE